MSDNLRIYLWSRLVQDMTARYPHFYNYVSGWQLFMEVDMSPEDFQYASASPYGSFLFGIFNRTRLGGIPLKDRWYHPLYHEKPTEAFYTKSRLARSGRKREEYEYENCYSFGRRLGLDLVNGLTSVIAPKNHLEQNAKPVDVRIVYFLLKNT